MKILVCLSVVPDTTSKITFTDSNTKFNTAGIQFIINPYDELSLTRALEITEQHGGTVTTVTVGLADTEANIRKALAVGAHDAVRINADPTDAYFVASEIAAYAKDKNFDIIFTGRESIDYNGGIVQGLLSGMLNIPCVNVVTKIDVDANSATCTRDIDGGKETVKVNLPAVISAQKELTEPRIPNMRGIMAARTKPLQVLESSVNASTGKFASFELPPAKAGCKIIPVEQAGDLIKILHSETKVI